MVQISKSQEGPEKFESHAITSAGTGKIAPDSSVVERSKRKLRELSNEQDALKTDEKLIAVRAAMTEERARNPHIPLSSREATPLAHAEISKFVQHKMDEISATFESESRGLEERVEKRSRGLEDGVEKR